MRLLVFASSVCNENEKMFRIVPQSLKKKYGKKSVNLFVVMEKLDAISFIRNTLVRHEHDPASGNIFLNFLVSPVILLFHERPMCLNPNSEFSVGSLTPLQNPPALSFRYQFVSVIILNIVDNFF